LNVTVRAPFDPNTREHGFVEPVQVLELAPALPLHPPNVEPLCGVARSAITAPLADVEMFGRQVALTV
jgi:hypothetical protein